jgi:type I restriction enzyme, R subunit
MARKKKAPELTFQQHVADYLVREHKYAVLEQSDITDTEHFIAEDQLWAFLSYFLCPLKQKPSSQQ